MPDFSQTATEVRILFILILTLLLLIILILVPFMLILIINLQEMEMVGIYLNDAHGIPHRLGFTLGNEFSDHTIGGHHAHNKLRPCSIGPEVFPNPNPNPRIFSSSLSLSSSSATFPPISRAKFVSYATTTLLGLLPSSPASATSPTPSTSSSTLTSST